MFFQYLDYANVFSDDLAIELPKHNNMNKHAIKLVDNKQPPYEPIYNLGQIEFETLKNYIKTNLKTGFI